MDNLRVSAIKCKHCKDTIFSRCRHDFRWCSCEKVAIDGGFDYIKVTGDGEDYEMVNNFEIEYVSKEELYDDWNSYRDKYGLIKDDSYE